MMRYISNICKSNILRWKSSIRIIILLILLGVIQIMYTSPFIEAGKEFGYPFQIFEPYIASFSHLYSSLLTSIIIIFIIGDVPIRNKGFEIYLIKGTKSKWLLGQWLYVAFCSFVFCLIILLLNVSMVASNAFFANEWSLTTTIMTGVIQSNSVRLFTTVPQNIISMDLPVNAAIWTFFLQYLLFLFLGSLTAFSNLMSNRIIAPAIIMFLNGFNWLLRMFIPEDKMYGLLSWFSPIFHGTYSEHQYRSSLVGGMATPLQSALILLGAIIVFSISSHIVIRKIDILRFTEGDFDG